MHGASTKEGGDAGDNEQMTVDTALYRIMHKAKIDCFKDLDDARFLSLKNTKL